MGRCWKFVAMILVAGMACAAPASAQVDGLTREMVRALYADFAVGDAVFRSNAEDLYGPIEDATWDVISPRIERLLSDPAYADYVYDRALSRIGTDMTDAELFLIGATIQQDATILGLSRLSLKKQEAFLTVASDLLLWLGDNHPAFCGDAAEGEPDPLAEAVQEFEFLADVDPDYAGRYYDIIIEAILAEIHQTPPVNRGGGTLGEADAMALYQAAMLAAVQASPRVDDLMAAILGDDDADLAAFCIIGSLAIQAIWDVPLALRPTLMGILIAEMQAGL